MHERSLLTVIGEAPRRGGHAYVMVRCECGAERPVRAAHVARGEVQTCGAAIHRPISRQPTRRRTWKARQLPMHTYAVEAVGLELVKIGKSRDVARRIDGLNSASAVDLRLLVVGVGDFERELHRELAAHRARREWFHLVPPVRAALARVLGS